MTTKHELMVPTRIKVEGGWVSCFVGDWIPTNIGEAEATDVGVGQPNTGDIVVGIQAELNGETVEIRLEEPAMLTHLVNGDRLAIMTDDGVFEVTGVASLLMDIREDLQAEGCPGQPEEALLTHLQRMSSPVCAWTVGMGTTTTEWIH